jgi:hypothetical protein
MVIFERFKERTHLNPCIQFKWVKQTSTVDEYVREYQRAKAHLISQTNIRGEFYYVWNFIGGLKEEIRKPIGLFQPKTLNNVINLAFEIEETMNVGVKPKPFLQSTLSQPTRQPYYFNYKSSKPLDSTPKPVPNSNPTKPQLTNSTKNTTNLTYDQKKALRLYFICNDKMSPRP